MMLPNFFLFISISFLLIVGLGWLIEKIRVPWIFSALLVGVLLAIKNPFSEITSSASFDLLAHIGMYFLLFLIGLEIDIKELRRQSKFIFSSTFFIILFEAVCGGLLIHWVFGTAWLTAFIASTAFATVGEVILIPILDEFKIIKTRFGQTVIGIGLLDDIIELITLLLVIGLVGSKVNSALQPGVIIGSVLALFVLSFGLSKIKAVGRKFQFVPLEPLFLFVLALLFVFIGIGEFAGAASLAALLAGISIKNFLPVTRLQAIENEVRTIGYGLFAPIFFLWAGLDINMKYLASAPLLILLVVIVTNGAKMLASWLAAHRQLGNKQSILLGIGLSVRFSLSIIIVKILFDNGLIGQKLYSVIIASSIVFQFVVPILFSRLLVRWKVISAR